jgi:hypothetical protein
VSLRPPHVGVDRQSGFRFARSSALCGSEIPVITKKDILRVDGRLQPQHLCLVQLPFLPQGLLAVLAQAAANFSSRYRGTRRIDDADSDGLVRAMPSMPFPPPRWPGGAARGVSSSLQHREYTTSITTFLGTPPVAAARKGSSPTCSPLTESHNSWCLCAAGCKLYHGFEIPVTLRPQPATPKAIFIPSCASQKAMKLLSKAPAEALIRGPSWGRFR